VSTRSRQDRAELYARAYRERAGARSWFCEWCGERVDSIDLGPHLRAAHNLVPLDRRA